MYSYNCRLDEVKVSGDDKNCKFIHKKCSYKNYGGDMNYHMTLNTISSVELV